MLTKKGKYGLKAMAHLAQFPPGEFTHVVDIAEERGSRSASSTRFSFELRSFGFVNSKIEQNGGYTLAREAETITVGEIVRAIDGPLAPIACASKTRYQRCDDCVSEFTCPVRLVMVEAQRALSQVLDNCSLARVRQSATRRDRRPVRVQPLAAVAAATGGGKKSEWFRKSARRCLFFALDQDGYAPGSIGDVRVGNRLSRARRCVIYPVGVEKIHQH